MNKYEMLEEKLINRSKILGTTLSMINSPLLVEKMNREELNFILFDAEHGVYNNENVMQSLQVCRLMGLPAFVRVADSEYHLIARAIYMGECGLKVITATELPIEGAPELADAIHEIVEYCDSAEYVKKVLSIVG